MAVMLQNKYVFAQLTAFLNRTRFNSYVRKYDGNRYVKHLTCWSQLLAMMFGQLSNRESLRDLIVAFEAHRAKQYHLELGRESIAKTTSASTNQSRDYRIFEDFTFYMMGQVRKGQVTDIFKLKDNVYAFDSTTIPLCLSVFWWVKFRKKKGGIKTHVLYDLESQVPAFFHTSTASIYDSDSMKEIPYESGSYYVFGREYDVFKELFKIHQHRSFFVVRARRNLQYKCCKWRRRLPGNILTGAVIEFIEYSPCRKYPEELRFVKFYDEERDKELAFLTDAFHLAAPEVTNLYKSRWQIELFFKWLRQHLKIKKFWDAIENAVRIQISSAIIAYCLVAIVQHNFQLKRSAYRVLQILSISLMNKTPLVDLFERTDFNNVRELGRPLFPGLFN